MKRFLAVAVLLAVGTVAMGDIVPSLVAVNNDSGSGDPDWPAGNVFTYDLVITVTDGPLGPDDWTSTFAIAETTGTFYEYPIFGTNGPPNPALFPAYPGLEFDCFYTMPSSWPNTGGLNAPSFVDVETDLQDQMRKALWFDTLDDGNGEFVIARFTASGEGYDGYLRVHGDVTWASTEGDLHPFDLEIPEPATLSLLGLGLALIRRR